MIIAIDGPAGSGKSTAAKRVAQKTGFLYIDTGAMYRAFTLKAVHEGIDLEDEEALEALTQKTALSLKSGNRELKVFLDNEDVTKAIRDQALTNKVAFIARSARVRDWMVGLQRKLSSCSSGAVLEGRDIGTVVFPDAHKKFYLDADVKERAERRYKELVKMGQEVTFADIERDVRVRDEQDKTRKIAPLRQAEDALYIDTTSMSIEEVVDKILEEIGLY